MKDNMIYL